jgi:TRAP-type C4-dicarboxylate transport system permease small subunit
MRPLIRRLAIGVFLLYLLAVTWPVATLVRSPEPPVFGLPLSMAWPVAWILIGLVMLLVLDHFENKDKAE